MTAAKSRRKQNQLKSTNMLYIALGYGLGWCYNHRPQVKKFLESIVNKI